MHEHFFVLVSEVLRKSLWKLMCEMASSEKEKKNDWKLSVIFLGVWNIRLFRGKAEYLDSKR